MDIILFLTNLDVDEDNYIEIITNTDELGFRPVKGDYVYLADNLGLYMDYQSVSPLNYEDFYDKEFLVKKCIIYEMDSLSCHCEYRSNKKNENLRKILT